MSDTNIVVATFHADHNRITMTRSLHQWDRNQVLRIVGAEALPQTFEAHFSNVKHGGIAQTVVGIDGEVSIPTNLLMTGKRIYCWIYVTDRSSAQTEYLIIIPVEWRPMPEYYDVEDTGVFDSVVNQVAEYAATATTGATSATASATAAAGSKAAAAASASAAADSAENAAASEANAGAFASAAQASDASAATAATTATSKAAEAAQSATSAGSAADRAEAAQDAAETAQEAAETAATSATADAATASTKATAAAASATTASTKATDATNAATTATDQAVAAEAAKTTAVEAKTAAQSAQSAAETAATTATAKATEAAASATAAAQVAASINTPDSALSDTSTNAVQNKVVTAEFADVKTAIGNLAGETGRWSVSPSTGAITDRTDNGKYFGLKDYMPCAANTFYNYQWFFASEVSTFTTTIAYKDSNGDFLSGTTFSTVAPLYKRTFKTPANAAYMCISGYNSSYFPTIATPAIQVAGGEWSYNALISKKADDGLLRYKYSKIESSNYVDIDIEESPGYFNENGVISSQSTNGEMYTQRFYSNKYSRVELYISFPTETTMAQAYGVWYKDGTFVRFLSTPTDIAYNNGIDLDDTIDYVMVYYRTYGTATVRMKGVINTKGLAGTMVESATADNINTRAVNGFNPLRFKSCYDHLFVRTAKAYITIPHESLYHVRISKHLGFDIIEANVASTSDGVYIVNHLNQGKFGDYFHDVDGTTDISNIEVSSVTWAWIVENVRYNSLIAKYRTRPCRLEEFLGECRQQNLIPFITSTNPAVVAIADKYMGKGNYIAYNASRTTCPEAIIFSWQSLSTKADILSLCQTVGTPFIYGMANPDDFTDAELKEIINTLHDNGFWIGTSYQDDNWYKYSYMGFDLIGANSIINRIETGNLYNIDSIYGFGGYTYTNATETNGVLTFTSDGTIKPNIENTSYSVCGRDVEIVFDGTITVGSKQYTSDGSIPFFRASVVINGSPDITISVASGTVIYDMQFKASVY